MGRSNFRHYWQKIQRFTDKLIQKLFALPVRFPFVFRLAKQAFLFAFIPYLVWYFFLDDPLNEEAKKWVEVTPEKLDYSYNGAIYEQGFNLTGDDPYILGLQQLEEYEQQIRLGKSYAEITLATVELPSLKTTDCMLYSYQCLKQHWHQMPFSDQQQHTLTVASETYIKLHELRLFKPLDFGNGVINKDFSSPTQIHEIFILSVLSSAKSGQWQESYIKLIEDIHFQINKLQNPITYFDAFQTIIALKTDINVTSYLLSELGMPEVKFSLQIPKNRFISERFNMKDTLMHELKNIAWNIQYNTLDNPMANSAALATILFFKENRTLNQMHKLFTELSSDQDNAKQRLINEVNSPFALNNIVGEYLIKTAIPRFFNPSDAPRTVEGNVLALETILAHMSEPESTSFSWPSHPASGEQIEIVEGYACYASFMGNFSADNDKRVNSCVKIPEMHDQQH